jgi:hypothetical protein
MHAKIITGCSIAVTKVLLNEEQHIFRSGRSSSDFILVLYQLIQKDVNLTYKHILFICYMKVFHKVLRNKLWGEIRSKG